MNINKIHIIGIDEASMLKKSDAQYINNTLKLCNTDRSLHNMEWGGKHMILSLDT